MSARPDSATRTSGIFVPVHEAMFDLVNGWRLAADAEGPLYAGDRVLLKPPARHEGRAA